MNKYKVKGYFVVGHRTKSHEAIVEPQSALMDDYDGIVALWQESAYKSIDFKIAYGCPNIIESIEKIED